MEGLDDGGGMGKARSRSFVDRHISMSRTGRVVGGIL